MIPVLKRKIWDWILPEYFGYLVDWTMSTFHTCIIELLLTSKTKCCDQLKEDLLNYISSLECFLIFSCWRQENKHFVVDTLFFSKMTSRETETHCVGLYSSNDGSFKNPFLVLNELSWKQPIIHVLSEVMKRKTVESNCFVIILHYQRTVSFVIETILSVFISTVKSL